MKRIALLSLALITASPVMCNPASALARRLPKLRTVVGATALGTFAGMIGLNVHYQSRTQSKKQLNLGYMCGEGSYRHELEVVAKSVKAKWDNARNKLAELAGAHK